MQSSNGNGTSNGFTTVTQDTNPPVQRQVRPLTSKQERKLVDYLDTRFLELTRNFKKRSEASSNLKTLSAYLEAVRRVLALILQIPPVDPSTSLRIAYLLRLTGDALGSIPGYTLGSSDATAHEALQNLVDFLDDLDQAWIAVLQGQIWDPESAEGVDLILPANSIGSSTTSGSNNNNTNDSPHTSSPPTSLKSTPPSQTDVTRLRSLLYAGQSALEEWLANARAHVQAGGDGGDEDDVSSMLARMGLLEDFDALFVRTLDFLGGFNGNVSRNTVDPLEESPME